MTVWKCRAEKPGEQLGCVSSCGPEGVCSGGKICVRSGDSGREGKCRCPESTPKECGDVCVDFNTDVNHCGGCSGSGGVKCGEGESCLGGNCRCGEGGACVKGAVCNSGKCECKAGSVTVLDSKGEISACSSDCGGEKCGKGAVCVDSGDGVALCRCGTGSGAQICESDWECKGGECSCSDGYLLWSKKANGAHEKLGCVRDCEDGQAPGMFDHCGSNGMICVRKGDSGRVGMCECPQVKPTLCFGFCVNTDTDDNHCGGWSGEGGKSCKDGKVCKGGDCVCPESAPILCGGGCVDTGTSAEHCGGCAGSGGKKCNKNEVCADGKCKCGDAEGCNVGVLCQDGVCGCLTGSFFDPVPVYNRAGNLVIACSEDKCGGKECGSGAKCIEGTEGTTPECRCGTVNGDICESGGKCSGGNCL